MLIIRDPNVEPSKDTWDELPFLHIGYAGGFDHLDKPDYIVGTIYETRWDEAIKKGRYGEGYCARIDAVRHLQNVAPFPTWNVDQHLPWSFIEFRKMMSWGANTDFAYDQPNGYDCCIPWTQRVHVYQKPGSHWLIDTFYHFFNNNTFNPYIGMMDGELRMWADSAAVTSNTYTVLATVPNTVNQWYDLEIRQEPLIPLQPVLNPTINPVGNPLQYRPITWMILVNGQLIYSLGGVSANVFDIVCRLGYTTHWGNTECFLDNYYGVFMTEKGIKYLDQPKWVIRKSYPEAVDCRGEWTAFDEVANTRSVDVDFTDYITFADGGKSMINSAGLRTVYEEDPPYTCTRGSYTKFSFNVPKPDGAIPMATWSVSLERYSTSVPNAFYGPWFLQPDRYGWTDRKTGSGYGTSRNTGASGNDPYWVTALALLSAGSRHSVYYRYLPKAENKGFVNIATEYVGATF